MRISTQRCEIKRPLAGSHATSRERSPVTQEPARHNKQAQRVNTNAVWSFSFDGQTPFNTMIQKHTGHLRKDIAAA